MDSGTAFFARTEIGASHSAPQTPIVNAVRVHLSFAIVTTRNGYARIALAVHLRTNVKPGSRDSRCRSRGFQSYARMLAAIATVSCSPRSSISPTWARNRRTFDETNTACIGAGDCRQLSSISRVGRRHGRDETEARHRSLSNGAGRRREVVLSRGRPRQRPGGAAAAWLSDVLAYVSKPDPAAGGPLSRDRAGLPGLRTERRARSQEVRLYLRPHRRSRGQADDPARRQEV